MSDVVIDAMGAVGGLLLVRLVGVSEHPLVFCFGDTFHTLHHYLSFLRFQEFDGLFTIYLAYAGIAIKLHTKNHRINRWFL